MSEGSIIHLANLHKSFQERNGIKIEFGAYVEIAKQLRPDFDSEIPDRLGFTDYTKHENKVKRVIVL